MLRNRSGSMASGGVLILYAFTKTVIEDLGEKRGRVKVQSEIGSVFIFNRLNPNPLSILLQALMDSLEDGRRDEGLSEGGPFFLQILDLQGTLLYLNRIVQEGFDTLHPVAPVSDPSIDLIGAGKIRVDFLYPFSVRDQGKSPSLLV